MSSESSQESLQLWVLYVCAEVLHIPKIVKNCTDLQSFVFQFRGIGVLFGGLNPPKSLHPWRRDWYR